MAGKQWTDEELGSRTSRPPGAPSEPCALTLPTRCPPQALTSAAGLLPAVPPPPPCGNRRSRRLAHPPFHSPGARPEAAPGRGRGGWWRPRQHRPLSGQGSPSQRAPGSVACWLQDPAPAPAHLPPVPFHSGYPSPRWVGEPGALSGGICCPDPQTFQPLGWAPGSSFQPPGLRGSWLVDKGPAGPLAAPGGARGPSAAQSAAAYQRQDQEDRFADVLSICSSVCPAVCSPPSSQHGSGGGFPKKVCSPQLGWVARHGWPPGRTAGT